MVLVETKAMIADTFRELIHRESVDKITVTQLIQECHISRQTFYYHFQDMLEVMEWSVRRETQRLLAQSRQMPDMGAALGVLIDFTVEQYPTLHRLLLSHRRYQFEQFLVDSLKDYLVGLVQFHCGEIAAKDGDRQAFVDYNACGLAGILLDRCGRADLDRARLAEQLQRMMTRQLQEP